MGRTLTRREWKEIQLAEQSAKPSKLAGKLQPMPRQLPSVPVTSVDEQKEVHRYLSGDSGIQTSQPSIQAERLDKETQPNPSTPTTRAPR